MVEWILILKKLLRLKQFRKRLLNWYAANARALPWRNTRNPYHIWVSEVMLQQTQVQTAVPYYNRFFKQFPDLETLARANLQSVLKIWEGMGYYGRARNLHHAAKQVVKEHNSIIPDTLMEFRKLKGVGEYIGSAVMSIAFHQPHAVVDGNVKRVLARLYEMDDPVNRSSSHKTFHQAASELLDTGNPSAFNQAMMELGALVCRPKNPKCSHCPVQKHCCAYKHGTTGKYPRRVPSAAIPEFHIAVGVVWKKDFILITQRRPEGLLGGLWEFPGGKVKKNETSSGACVREIAEETGLTIRVDSHLTRVKHAYTHFKIDMDVFICKHVSGRVRLNGPDDHRWVKLAHIHRYPFPGANHKFIPLLKAPENVILTEKV